jgi:hypothetical protein
MIPTRRGLFATLFGLVLLGVGPVHAQVDLGAGLDVEYRMGGEDSRFLLNEIPSAEDVPQSGSPEPHFALRQVNLFVFSQISSDFFFEGRLQIDNIGSGGLNPPRVGLAYLGWQPQGVPITGSVGRFVNPFGQYPRQSLAFRNDFVAAPLLYGYGVNVTQGLGYRPGAQASTRGYFGWDKALTTLYRTGYVTGAKGSWTIAENTLVWDLAIVNNAPTSRKSISGAGNAAVITRMEVRPAVFWTQGVSFSHGAFMDQHPQNRPLRQNESLRRFRQTLIGTDFQTGYSYFALSGEVAYTIWSVPGYRQDATPPYQDGAFVRDEQGDPARFRLTQWGGHVDAKFEPPFLSGSYLAVRGGHLYFPKRTHPVTGNTFKWDSDVTRLSAVVGYKLHPRIITKVSFTEQTPFDGSLYSLRVQVTSMF